MSFYFLLGFPSRSPFIDSTHVELPAVKKFSKLGLQSVPVIKLCPVHNAAYVNDFFAHIKLI